MPQSDFMVSFFKSITDVFGTWSNFDKSAENAQLNQIKKQSWKMTNAL